MSGPKIIVRCVLLLLIIVNTACTTPRTNPVGYFEIPVIDLNRAIRFYYSVFGFAFTRETIDGNQMALLPLHEGARGISGALAQGKTYVPSTTGTLVYFDTENIDASLSKAVTAGGKMLYPKTSIGPSGFVAEFQDSEGNRIGLHQRKQKISP